jgi:hypothetical protein
MCTDTDVSKEELDVTGIHRSEQFVPGPVPTNLPDNTELWTSDAEVALVPDIKSTQIKGRLMKVPKDVGYVLFTSEGRFAPWPRTIEAWLTAIEQSKDVSAVSTSNAT